MTPEEALSQIRALCDELARENAYSEDGVFAGVFHTVSRVRAVLDAVSVDATPAQGIDRALDEIHEAFRRGDQWYSVCDRILALVRLVEGIVLSPEEAAFVSKGLRHSQWWVQEDVDRAYALASRLEASS